MSHAQPFPPSHRQNCLRRSFGKSFTKLVKKPVSSMLRPALHSYYYTSAFAGGDPAIRGDRSGFVGGANPIGRPSPLPRLPKLLYTAFFHIAGTGRPQKLGIVAQFRCHTNPATSAPPSSCPATRRSRVQNPRITPPRKWRGLTRRKNGDNLDAPHQKMNRRSATKFR